MSITFSTAWYPFKAKFDHAVYQNWIDNMLTNVNQYNLVIYCDSQSYPQVRKYESNPRIKIIQKPHNQFYTYRYRSDWINNHERNDTIKNLVDWKLNMLWSEKIHFVYQTMVNKYFDTDFYGWCDIGYFRNRSNDLMTPELVNWSNPEKVALLQRNQIHYACIQNNSRYMALLRQIVCNKNDLGLPVHPIPPNQLSFAGGFFICPKSRVEWWRNTLDEKLALYFQHGFLVKDDQIIVADCILSNPDQFAIHMEDDPRYDNWFLFQRVLR
jgi:hypothetical protein